MTNFVIESSSLEVDRRQKQRKTDRLDARKMVFALRRYHHQAEQSALRPIRVPSPQDEDLRNLQRCLQSVRREKRRLMTRIKGLLFAQGICLEQILTLNHLLTTLERAMVVTWESIWRKA